MILNRPREYDQALESFSKPLMERVEYTLDDRMRMTVTNDTADFYRYIDLTEATRITIEFIRETIETELPAELRFLAAYDEIMYGDDDMGGSDGEDDGDDHFNDHWNGLTGGMK